ncbi:MAG: hypothetical protein HQ568_02595 [Calditrichaeota bacterium]|nr:hypothetical protein [Calditrichota bacterium]
MDKLNMLDYKDVTKLASEYGLPLHIYFPDRFALNAATFKPFAEQYYSNILTCFAAKSNPCLGAIKLAASHGLGLDAVSEYELQAGLDAGIPPERIVCNGNAKTDAYIDLAVSSGALIVIDNRTEMELVNRTALLYDRKAKVILRFAGMPLEGLTAADHSTASAWTKFGFSIDEADDVFRLAAGMDEIETVGISAHIGTQVCDASGYDRLMQHLLELAGQMKASGMTVKYINIGGGFPVCYCTADEWKIFKDRLIEQLSGNLPTDECVSWDNNPMGFAGEHFYKREWHGKAYWSEFPGALMLKRLLLAESSPGATVINALESLGKPTLIVEPGRALLGTAGVTIAEVMGVKQVLGNHVVMLDMGIVNHGHALISPDMHPMEIIPDGETDAPVEAFIAGRLCFTGDMISKVKVKLNRLPERGELMVIHHTGTYSADHFASNSCGFPRPTKVVVRNDGSVDVWRGVETYEDVFIN